jgi:hypothetical protein
MIKENSPILPNSDPHLPQVKNAIDIRDVVPVEPGVYRDPKGPNVYYFDNATIMRDFQLRQKPSSTTQ